MKSRKNKRYLRKRDIKKEMLIISFLYQIIYGQSKMTEEEKLWEYGLYDSPCKQIYIDSQRVFERSLYVH